MGKFNGFPKDTLKFLRGLEKNNKKDWFEAHRAEYDDYYIEPAKAFVEAIGPKLKKISKSLNAEPRINGSIFRINRDVRFSKDKTPYKPHVDLWFWEGKDRSWDCSGFFFRLTPKRLILGGGMHQFGKPSLDKYRKAVVDAKRGAQLQKIVGQMKKAGYDVGGKSYKKVPRGFPAEHPRADLLLHGGLFASTEVAIPRELHSPKFVAFCEKHFKKMAPVHSWLVPLAKK